MCRALKVLCVAEDDARLTDLRAATVSAEWELASGATTEARALQVLHEERPHVLVVFGAFDDLVERALEAYPFLRVVADREIEGAQAVRSMDEIRDAVKGRARPGGPVRR